MVKKYIVKNCPCFLGEDIQCASYPVLCKNKHNCLIKQVIDDCKESIKHYENKGWKSDDCLKLCGEASMSFKLLQLFEIEEIE